MKIRKSYLISILTIFFITIISTTVLAAGTYVKDDGSVLKKATIEQVNANFDKLKTNTGAVVRFQTVQSLGGKSIDDLAKSIGSSAGTDRWAVMVVSIQDHKTKFMIGQGLNAVFSSSEIDKISHIPDNYFKNKDFDGGILAAGKAIDQDITTTAVKTGNAAVKTDGMSTTVVPKKTASNSNAGKMFLYFVIGTLVIGGGIFVVILLVKRKSEKDMKEFQDRVGYHPSNSNTYRSASMNDEPVRKKVVHEEVVHERVVKERPVVIQTPTVVHHTTVVKDRSNDRLVEGMLLNEMMHNHHDSHHHNHHDNHHSSYDDNHRSGESNWNSNDDDDSKKYTSGDWNSGGSSDWSSPDTSSGSSDWGSSDSSSSYDSGSGSGGGSDW